MTITDKADFKAKVRASMCQLQNDPEKIRTKNYRSNMPPDSAFTYGLINKSPRNRGRHDGLAWTIYARCPGALVRKLRDAVILRHGGLVLGPVPSCRLAIEDSGGKAGGTRKLQGGVRQGKFKPAGTL